MKISNLTTLILTKNEETFIEDCLKSCEFCGDIIIIDSGSTDKTIEIAKKYTDKIRQKPFTNFLDQRQYALEQASSKWVLFLDADERISEKLKEEIEAFCKQDQFSTMLIPRKNLIHKTWVKHSGWYPDFQIRLIKREGASFHSKIVHEQLKINGEAKYLEPNKDQDIIHFTYKNFSQYIEKVNKYTSLEAEYYKDSNEFKLTRFGIFSRSLGMFTQTLFHNKGYKDGMLGFIVAGINFIYSFLLMIKLWEKRQYTPKI